MRGRLRPAALFLALALWGWLAPSGVEAGIAFRAAGTYASAASGNPLAPGSVPPGLPAGWQPDDIHIAIIASKDNVASTMPAGWTLLNEGNSGTSHRSTLFWRRAQAGDVAPTITHTAGNSISAQIIGFSGVDPLNAFDVANSFTVSTSATDYLTEAGAIETVTPNTMLVFTGHLNDNYKPATLGTPTGSTPWTLAFQSNTSLGLDTAIGAYYGLRTSTGVQPAVAAAMDTSGTAATSHGAQLALRPCGSADLSYVSATGGSTTVTLYWPSSNVIVYRKTTAFAAGDVPVYGTTYAIGTGTGPGGSDVIYNPASAATSYTDTPPLTNTKYYYKVVAKWTAGPCYAPGAASLTEVSITPGQTNIAWSYAATGGSMLNPGIAGSGTIYPSSNAARIVSIDTATGAQSSSWTSGPVATTGAVQGWLTWVPLKGGTTNVVIAGDQAPGGMVYARNAASGAVVPGWTDYQTNPVTTIQAGVAVQLWDYSNSGPGSFQETYTSDIIFAASMNGATTNKLYAIKASDGTLAWSFNGTVDTGNSVSDITGMPYVDYARNRIYVASKAASGRSLWVINSLTGSSVACNGTDCTLGSLDSSPTLSYNGTTLYVGNEIGKLYALTTSTTPALTLKWSAPFDLGVGNGNVQGFVWQDYTTAGRLYFTTTTGKVMCVDDNGTSAAACAGWTVNTVAAASTPLLLNKLFVGSSDGKVHQINITPGASFGADEKQVNVDLTGCAGPGPCTVGDVSTETAGEIFVGTSAGKIYRINLNGSGELPP
jgi:hypothetical protein